MLTAGLGGAQETQRLEPGSITLQELDRPAPAGTSAKLFEMLPSEATGIDFANQAALDADDYWALNGMFLNAGVCVGDIDGDGLPDIFLPSPISDSKLYLNQGNLKFKEITGEAGIDPAAKSGGATFVDIDNDRDLDLYVCNYYQPNSLYINDGTGRFSEAAKRFGLDYSGASVMMAFADYDLDGDLDGYLVTNRSWEYQKDAESVGEVVEKYVEQDENGQDRIKPEFREFRSIIELPGNRKILEYAGQADVLFRNENGNFFVDVTNGSGIEGFDQGLAATWWDYNNDGLIDLYVSNDFLGPDKLYHNMGNGRFSDVAPQALPHTPWFSMGATVADLNNDTLPDFLATDMSGSNHFKQKMGMGSMGGDPLEFTTTASPQQYMRNAVYINTNTPFLQEAAYLTHMDSTDWTWTVKAGDMDNDGWLDVFYTNGMTRDWVNSDLGQVEDRLGGRETAAVQEMWMNQPMRREPNFAFQNHGDLHFEDVSDKWGLDYVGVSHGAAFSDLDRDGDTDLIVSNFGDPVSVYRNNAAGQNSVIIQLQGLFSNRYGIDSKIVAETKNGKQFRQLTLSTGFMSADEPVAHFGLGDAETIDKLTIDWPGFRRQVFENLKANRIYTITEPNAPPKWVEPPQVERIFQMNAALGVLPHRETPYDDFKDQPLLPNQLSQLGPGISIGDVEGDGGMDIYVSGSSDYFGYVYMESDGLYRERLDSPFKEDSACEDMGSLWFDADGDGDQDLYVVSGGYEFKAGSEQLRDRLYLNQGGRKFSRAGDDILPDYRDSGSCVSACDFDRDGDLDLFVGGRLIPGQYPLAPASRLLVNEGGRFHDAAPPELAGAGMVTSAVWTDIDNDGWTDLALSIEWGPVHVFKNMDGKLTEHTSEAGLDAHRGWWNGIDSGDIDNDGDMDLVVTNFGLNTKYHASAEKPARIYYGRFAEGEPQRIIEAEYEGDTLYPVRGKSCSSRAMPHLTQKFTTYQNFALASLTEIYTPQCLNDSYILEVNTLESGVLLNDGSGRFSFQPLPRMAQIAPGFGVQLADMDGDGNLDIVMAQNSYSPQIETGQMDGGLSVLLLGDGQGAFKPIEAYRSGIAFPGDAKSLALTDFNRDGRADLLVGVNNSGVAGMINQAPVERVVQVRLKGKAGNLDAVGGRVEIQTTADRRRIHEIKAGGGYLSQSLQMANIALADGEEIKSINVRWPDGGATQATGSGGRNEYVISQP